MLIGSSHYTIGALVRFVSSHISCKFEGRHTNYHRRAQVQRVETHVRCAKTLVFGSRFALAHGIFIEKPLKWKDNMRMFALLPFPYVACAACKVSTKLNFARRYKFSLLALIKIYFNFIAFSLLRRKCEAAAFCTDNSFLLCWYINYNWLESCLRHECVSYAEKVFCQTLFGATLSIRYQMLIQVNWFLVAAKCIDY